MKTNLQVGDYVQYLNAVGGGKILRFLPGGRIVLEDDDGFEDIVSTKELLMPLSENKIEEKKEIEVVERSKIISSQPGLEEWKGYRVGDYVRPIDDDFEGVVVRISITGILSVEIEDGLIMEYRPQQLVKADKGMEDKLIHSVFKAKKLIKADDYQQPIKAKKTNRKESGTWEIDLHVHEITDETDFLTPGELLQIQLDFFEKKLQEALKRKVRRVIFIHGRGKGKLRDEIRVILSRYPNCEFYDGNYLKYGQGATEVIIWNR